jgi:membrane protein required for colicin V production
MTVVDVVIIFVICLSTLFSLLRGFVKEAISLASWLLAIWLATSFSGRLAEILPASIESEAVRQSVGFGVLFVLTLMVGSLVNYLVAGVVKKTGLSGADRVFGMFFGFLRGAMIILVFVVVGGMTPIPQQSWWQSSILLERFARVAVELQDFLPQDMHVAFDPADISGTLPQALPKALPNAVGK